MSKFLTVSLVIVAFVAGTGFGFYLAPEYALLNQSSSAMGGTAKPLSDQQFLDGMIAHHEVALDLARQAKRQSKRDEILKLADVVLAVDTEEIAGLYTWKQQWFQNTRKVSGKEISTIALGSYDAKFDLRLLNALITHHVDAIAMAKKLRASTTRNELLDLADAVIEGKTKQIAQFEQWRSEWYGNNN
ncbi:MAG: DUF305 domain-containing protein [bacterium]